MKFPKRIIGAINKEFNQVVQPIRKIKQSYDRAWSNWEKSPRYKKAQDKWNDYSGRL